MNIDTHIMTMSYIVYGSHDDSAKKIEPLGIYSDILKARECLHSSYTKEYLTDDYDIKVIGEDDVAVYKINRGYFSDAKLPCVYYRIVKCGFNGLFSTKAYVAPPPRLQQISARPAQLQGIQIDPDELKAQLGALKPPYDRKPAKSKETKPEETEETNSEETDNSLDEIIVD